MIVRLFAWQQKIICHDCRALPGACLRLGSKAAGRERCVVSSTKLAVGRNVWFASDEAVYVKYNVREPAGIATDQADKAPNGDVRNASLNILLLRASVSPFLYLSKGLAVR